MPSQLLHNHNYYYIIINLAGSLIYVESGEHVLCRVPTWFIYDLDKFNYGLVKFNYDIDQFNYDQDQINSLISTFNKPVSNSLSRIMSYHLGTRLMFSVHYTVYIVHYTVQNNGEKLRNIFEIDADLLI